MLWRFYVILLVGALLEWESIQCAPADVTKSKEKIRAYEFGFSIEENQHRHEKRDENGIVMGEFGFITADGKYHVTVYATDENGKFKILAMKSYPYGSPENRIMIARPQTPIVIPMTRKGIPLDTPSCGGCVLTKKTTPAPNQVKGVPETVFRPLSKAFNEAKKVGPGITKPSLTPVQSVVSLSTPKLNTIVTTPQKTALGSPGNGKKYQLTNLQIPARPALPVVQIPVTRQSQEFSQNTIPDIGIRLGFPNVPMPSKQELPSPLGETLTPASTISNFAPSPSPNDRTLPHTLLSQGQQSQQNAFTPNTAKETANVQVPPQIQITIQPLNMLQQQPGQVPTQSLLTNRLTPPTGLQQQNTNVATTPTTSLQSTSIKSSVAPSTQSFGKTTPTGTGGGPLYRFNYVLDYNSHREEGRIDGSKEGKYNTIDENGIRRIIDYIANENGYQPHIKWERVPPNELPPTGENKLKEYEFVWFN